MIEKEEITYLKNGISLFLTSYSFFTVVIIKHLLLIDTLLFNAE